MPTIDQLIEKSGVKKPTDEVTDSVIQADIEDNSQERKPLLEAMTHARNRYRRMPVSIRRRVDAALGTGIYKRPMKRRGALFIHVPKAAGTAVSQSLFGLKAVGHYTAQEACDYDPKLYSRLFTFAFVRNPISRAVSAYNYLRTGGTAEVPVAFPRRYAHIAKLSFDEFVEWLETIDVDRSNPVLHRQTKYVCDGSGQVLVEYMGRFESIEQDFEEVCRRLNIEVQLGRRNTSGHPQFRPGDAGTEQRLRKVYESDFQHLGYE